MTDSLDYLAPVSSRGCMVCNTQQTVLVDGYGGRRCADHPTTFDPQRAVDLMLDGMPATAFSYVRWSA